MWTSGRRNGYARQVTANDKAFDLLDFIVDAKEPPGLTQLVQMSALKKATVRRLLLGHMRQGFVRQDSQKRYLPGLRLLDMAAVAFDSLDLVSEAREVVEGLSDQVPGTLTFAVYADRHLHVALSLASSDPYRVAGRGLGSTGLYATAAGKAVLAFLPPPDVGWLLGPGPWTRYTPNTIGDVDSLAHDLTQVAQCGYALNNEESRLGLRCLAVPIRGHLGRPVAVISISVATSQTSVEDLRQATEPMLFAADTISARIGGPPATLRTIPLGSARDEDDGTIQTSNDQ
jgi:DNA-binding IclR family transcriptional regulator